LDSGAAQVIMRKWWYITQVFMWEWWFSSSNRRVVIPT